MKFNFKLIVAQNLRKVAYFTIAFGACFMYFHCEYLTNCINSGVGSPIRKIQGFIGRNSVGVGGVLVLHPSSSFLNPPPSTKIF